MDCIIARNLFSLLIFTSYLAYNTHGLLGGVSYTVYIVNGLPDNSHLLKVHCFSGDNDIGYHDLKVSENIHWSFKTSVWSETKFYCHFWWNDKERRFGAFTSRIANSYCGNDLYGNNACWWLVKSDGFYIANVINPAPDYLQYVNWWMPVGSGGV